MNNRILFIAISLVTSLIFTSCTKDQYARPVITILELGLDNSRIAFIGGDLHIEAEIVAEAKISLVTLELHQEEGSSEEIVVDYTEFAGLKNTTFHKHVDIPVGTPAGTYHFHLTVTDQEGNQTTVEEEITLEESMSR